MIKISKYCNKAYFFIFCILFLFSCSSTPPPKPTWPFCSKAITLNYSADKLLNEYDGKPHTVEVMIYQLSDNTAFNKLLKYNDGIVKLLDDVNFDNSVKASQSFFVEPGAIGKIVLDRAKDAQWVAIVVGFVQLKAENVSLSFKIPYEIDSTGIIFRDYYAQVEPLNLNIIMDKDRIRENKQK